MRQRLLTWQRAFAQGRDIVTEGRDQGTIVFADAGCKFFLTADPEERLERRARELGLSVDREALRAKLQERDQRDANRDLAPLRAADDAVVIDRTHLDADAVVAAMEAEVRRRLG